MDKKNGWKKGKAPTTRPALHMSFGVVFCRKKKSRSDRKRRRLAAIRKTKHKQHKVYGRKI